MCWTALNMKLCWWRVMGVGDVDTALRKTYAGDVDTTPRKTSVGDVGTHL